jgi:hypothetical protein
VRPRALVLGIALAAIGAALPALAREDGVGVPPPGAELPSPSRECLVKVLQDAGNGHLRARLYARARLVLDIADTREMAWVDEVLLFSVSPDYGKPGIYAWQCPERRVRRVVEPTRTSHDHPDGTDYYRILRIDGETLYYAHAADAQSRTLEQDLRRDVGLLLLGASRTRVALR